MKVIRAQWAVYAVLALLIGGAAVVSRTPAAFVAQAQNLGQRSVTGAVVDADSKPVAGATVFLKNQKTKAIRSFTSTQDGRFHFAQVNMSLDFDLWAEKDGRKTPVKTVSSWDARKDFETELKLK
ncbi:MAG TPA: carboxypeptidase-like regulatory domain-containing protein [Terracidiphilus sp.]|nr:carboxypeptidase-like regulatory domain-containing protein [Terracidiphilus sp.]